jgi:hypothetical protein
LWSITRAATSTFGATSIAAVLRFALMAESEKISAWSLGLLSVGVGPAPFVIHGDCWIARFALSAAGLRLVDCS